MVIKNILDCYKHIPYTIKHRHVFIKVEIVLTGSVRFKSYLHDLDKLFLYVLFPYKGTEFIQNIHRKLSNHHPPYGKDYVSMVIDWECARLTKPDKPLNARDTLYKIYPRLIDTVEPILKELNL